MKIKIAILLMVYSLGSYVSENMAASADEQSLNRRVIASGTNVESDLASSSTPSFTNKDVKGYGNNLNQHDEPLSSVPPSPDPKNVSASDSASLSTTASAPITTPPVASSSILPAATVNVTSEQYSIESSPASTPSESSGFFDIPMSAFWWGIPITIFVLTLGSVLLVMRDMNKKKFKQLHNQNQPKNRNSLSMSNNPLATNAGQTNAIQLAGNKTPANKLIDEAGRNRSAQTTLAETRAKTSLLSSTTSVSTPLAAPIAPEFEMTDEIGQIDSSTPVVTSGQSLSNESDAAAVLTPVEPAQPAIPEPPYRTTILSHRWKLFGISKQGQAHLAKVPGIPCQDSHYIRPISDDWGVVVVCDGAGSQAYSQYGAAFVAKEIAEHLAEGIPQTNIYKTKQLPSPEVWNQYCKTLVRNTRIKLGEWIIGNSEIEGASIRDVGCTLIWAVYTPMGLLTGHVGDGRAGYRDADGWHEMMIPWEGEYSNQTVFINTDSIYVNHLENQSDPKRPFLESRVIDNPNIDAFILMSDGCESGLYETVAYDSEKNANVKINKPHAGICDNIIQMLENKLAETSSDERETEQLFMSIVEEGNTALKNEGDDKTLVLGFLSKPIPLLNDSV